METTLVAVSLVSLALASAMALVTWRVLSLERRREAARVEALRDLASLESEEPTDLRLFAEDEYSSTTIFATADRESASGRRIVAVAAVAAVMALAVGALLFAGRAERAGLKTGPSMTDSASAASTAGTAGPQAVSPGVPLELISLRHQREGDRLTITGLVRNPRHGARVSRVSAVAFVFDPAGTFIASERALVDFLTLNPGEESPFVVTVAAPGRIGRYRIGFRGEDGAVVGHVDHRAGI